MTPDPSATRDEALTDGSSRSPGLAAQLKEGTWSLHGQAERSGVVAEILRGRVSRRAYLLFLRNLLPAYQQLERGLESLRDLPYIQPIACREVYRAASLETDLIRIGGVGWPDTVPLLPAAEHYADAVSRATQGGGAALIAHAYVRYLGDLNGGRALKRLLAQALGLDDGSLSFYDFAKIADLEAFRHTYRAAFDLAGSSVNNLDVIVAEARAAFLLNIAVSCEAGLA